MSSLSVIVPVYNEQKFLAYSLDRLLSAKIADEIIIIDDGSTDDSASIAKHYEDKYDNIKLLLSSSNKGKGSALTLAKEEINCDFVTIHDADLEYFPEDLHLMYEKIKSFPQSLVIGSRFIGTKKRKNLYRRTVLANKLVSVFFSFVFNKRITDIATCYKMMSSENFIKLNLIEKGFSIEIEIVAKYLRTSLQIGIHEVPIQYEGRSYQEGKKIKALDGIKYLIKTLRYRVF